MDPAARWLVTNRRNGDGRDAVPCQPPRQAAQGAGEQRDEVRSGFQPLYFLGGDGAQRGQKGGVSSSLGFWVFLAD